MKTQLLDYLSGHLTENRNALFDKVLKDRTRYLTVVLEDIYQSHNASAVLRSCDCFGIQDIHIIENRNKYTVNRDVALGSAKWLSLKKYNQNENNSQEALQKLKKQGYRIVATTPHSSDVELYDFDVTKGKTALVFGTELTGVSELVKQEADEFLRIPMYGFTESFNISVSAALVLQHLAHEIRKRNVNWQLSKQEMEDVKLQWIKASVKSSDLIEREYYNKYK
ncbi:tRNA (guanosine-2'-O-)-methyltransferase [Saccharicrinis carchari]|uniref:tRNA (guanosine(18)-2'-O)-methyltransferase n=1 Tax=Saccharicrinis carchari TaxID=1168039 RepID=A0A521DM76_SACCC|nr:RNA methyltransferase [Saccharicrinis carchari]SMO72824.1 tRNA (guanosine-2'-O-)-methyltransferase [Saccharicrinis carchari]